MDQTAVEAPAGLSKSWKCGPLSRSSKEDYLAEVIPRVLELHPFYSASPGLMRVYGLDGKVTPRQIESGSPLLVSSNALYANNATPRGTLQRLLGVGAGGVVLLGRRPLPALRNVYNHLADSSFTVTEGLPSLSTTPLRTHNTSVSTNNNNTMSSSVSSGVSLLHDGVRGGGATLSFAVKFVSLEGASLRMIGYCLREARVLRSCNFFSVMKLYHSYVTVRSEVSDIEETIEARDWIAPHRGITGVTLELEYMNSGDLRAELETRARHTPRRFFSQRNLLLIFVQLVMAVHYLHARKKTLHRDIKAANVFLCSNGLVKLGDFGFSKPYDGPDGVRLARIGSFCGTPQYMAPEVWSVEPYGEKADMFSLGVVLFEMMELRRPFVGTSVETIRQAVLDGGKNPPILENDMYAKVLRTLVLRLLDMNPERRPSALNILSMPLMRETIGTLLDVVFRDPAAASERSTSSVALNASVSTEVSGSLPAAMRSPMTPSTKANANGTLNLSGEERDAILVDVRNIVADVVRYLVRPDLDVPSTQASTQSSPQTTTRSASTSLPPLATPMSVPRAPSVTSFPTAAAAAAESTTTTLMAGTLHKESGKGEWKRRYLELVRRDVTLRAPSLSSSTATSTERSGVATASFELYLSVSQKSREQGGPRKAQQLAGYIDCYPIEMDAYSGFALQSGNGSVLRFVTPVPGDRERWVEVLLECILRLRPVAQDGG